MSQPRVFAFAGSTRAESFNRRLLGAAVRVAERLELDVDHVELSDYPMPIFNQDDEAEHGQDPNATALRRKLERCDGLLLACPEYNSSITPLMKNVIDWMSRSEDGGSGVEVYDGKKALLLGASPGKLGGSRSIATVRSILGNIGVDVLDAEVTLPRAHEALDEDGRVTDDERRQHLEATVRAFAAFLRGEQPLNPS
jgi:NAD(P)H-dependent FMN reductase